MSYRLSLPPQSPLQRSFSETPYMRSVSSLTDDASTGTVRHYLPRNVSTGSLASLTSLSTSSWRKRDENTPLRVSSRSLLDLIDERSTGKSPRKPSNLVLRKPSWGTETPLTPCSNSKAPSILEKETDVVQETNIEDPFQTLSTAPEEDTDFGDASTRFDTPLEYVEEESILDHISEDEHEHDITYEERTTTGRSGAAPFKRWISTLRRRNLQRKKGLTPRIERWSLDDSDVDTPPKTEHRIPDAGHRKSGSLTSSLAFVVGIKSATITLASTSVAPRSGRGGRGSHPRNENRSSGFSDARVSMDSAAPSLGPIMDEEAWLRSLQRRRILEELISSEESYLGDMKVLVGIYSNLLAPLPSLSLQTRNTICQTVTEIVQLHEELLGELYKTIPNAEYTSEETLPAYELPRPKHMRWHSADVVSIRMPRVKLARKLRLSLDLNTPKPQRSDMLVADIKTAASVAKIFDKLLKRFFAYEAFTAHNEILVHDADSLEKAIPTWHAISRGVEALAIPLASINNRDASRKKALTLRDLLIKPVQRLLKYPLIFENLCKQTPACDDPESHAEIEKVYFRTLEVAAEINKATDDNKTKRSIETTWLLQDRLAYENQAMSRAVIMRLLGRVLLCGALHVAYESNERVKGQYMICILYRSCLVLATVNKSLSIYDVVIGIGLANANIEDADNGRGLQCHTAPHTWKLVFESGHRLFELILSACSAKEEEEWKNSLRTRIAAETHDGLLEGRFNAKDLFSTSALDLKSIGTVFGQPGSFARRMSIRRAATLGPKSNLHQVIIKNTQAQKTSNDSRPIVSVPINRSQSHSSTGHIPTLAPRRAERIRLEAALADVWTRDVLPYPGMGPRRSENPIRASANSVMRKLSMASITSNFSKRSASYTSLSNSRNEDTKPRSRKVFQHSNRPKQPVPDNPQSPVVVDFHRTPAAFLPPDFELEQKPSSKSRRMSFRGTVGERRCMTPQPPKPTSNSALRWDPTRIHEAPSTSHSSIADSFVTTATEVQEEKSDSLRQEPAQVPDNNSQPGVPPTKRPSKSRSRLFKMLRVK